MIFSMNIWYFHNALIRANYNNQQKDVHETTEHFEPLFKKSVVHRKQGIKKNSKGNAHINASPLFVILLVFLNFQICCKLLRVLFVQALHCGEMCLAFLITFHNLTNPYKHWGCGHRPYLQNLIIPHSEIISVMIAGLLLESYMVRILAEK